MKQRSEKTKTGCVSETLSLAGDPLRNHVEHASEYSHHKIRRLGIYHPLPSLLVEGSRISSNERDLNDNRGPASTPPQRNIVLRQSQGKGVLKDSWRNGAERLQL